MPAWLRQKELQLDATPNPGQVTNIIGGIPSPRDMCLVGLCYLAAARISEVTPLIKENITFTTQDGIPIMLIEAPNRKHKKKHFKTLPIRLDGSDKDIVDLIRPYIEHTQPGALLFQSAAKEPGKPISNRWAHAIIKRTGLSPHYLRHVRLSNLVKFQGLQEQYLIMFSGWSDSRPAKFYIQLNWQDLLKHL